jgi:hypothetical protein
LRIRTIKPEFWINEKLCSLDECTHLFAAALLNYVDDEGYFNANPGLIKGALFPIRETSRTIPVMLQELSQIGYLNLGETSDGRKYGFVVHFSKHQVINKPKESNIKNLEISWDTTVLVPYSSGTSTTGKGTGKGTGNREQGVTRARAHDVVDHEFDTFWKTYPKKIGKKAALKAFQKAKKAGMPPIKVIVAAIEQQRSCDQWKRDNGQYIPNPTTWLNQGRWDDELKEGHGRKLLPQEETQAMLQEWLEEEEMKESNGKRISREVLTADIGGLPRKVEAYKTDGLGMERAIVRRR